LKGLPFSCVIGKTKAEEELEVFNSLKSSEVFNPGGTPGVDAGDGNGDASGDASGFVATGTVTVEGTA
jgi:hypothetical protein